MKGPLKPAAVSGCTGRTTLAIKLSAFFEAVDWILSSLYNAVPQYWALDGTCAHVCPRQSHLYVEMVEPKIPTDVHIHLYLYIYL